MLFPVLFEHAWQWLDLFAYARDKDTVWSVLNDCELCNSRLLAERAVKTFAVHHSSAAIPRCDAAGQDALNRAAVEATEDL